MRLQEFYYLNVRYYDPADKRFLPEDTYRGSENDPNTLHLYAYCANNPVNYVDPSGHFALSTGAIAALTAALIAATEFMSTPEFQNSWRNFCTMIGNGLSSVGNQIRKGVQKVWSGTKPYVLKVQSSVEIYTKIPKAQSKIEDKVKRKKQKYFEGYMNSINGFKYITIGRGISFAQAKSRIRRQNNVFAINKHFAKSLAGSFTGIIGPEIDKNMAGVAGYFYHYHVQNRKNKAHIW